MAGRGLHGRRDARRVVSAWLGALRPMAGRVSAAAARMGCGWLLAVVCVAGVQGMVFLRNAGALSIPDPDLHVPSAYALATGQSLLPRTVMTEDVFGNRVRRPLVTGDDRYLTGLVRYNRTLTDAMSGMPEPDPSIAGQRTLLSREPLELTARPRATQYTPVAYLPQAIGLRMAWSRNANPYTALQYARAANLVTYLLLCCTALMLMPHVCRPLASLIACLPACCFLAASLTTDGTLTGMAMLLTAIAMRAADRDEPMGVPSLAGACLLTGLLVWGKAPYATCALLVAVLPRRILPHAKRAVYLIFCLGAGIAYLAWSRAYSGGYYNASLADNLAYAAAHPFTLLARVAANIPFIPQTTLTPTFQSLGSLLIVLTLWLHGLRYGNPARPAGKPPIPLNTASRPLDRHRYRVAAGVALFASLLLIILFVALTWNDLDAGSVTDPIHGIQGRYLTPLLPLLLATLVPTDHGETASK